MTLVLFDEIQTLRKALEKDRRAGRAIAFVPTMGYLHEGHASLIRHAATLAPRVVVSIFVNPLQFGPQEDYGRYPRDLEHDKQLAEAAGATDIFAPASPEAIIPRGLCVEVDPGPLAKTLCGKSRPGHFKGVTTIVTKLFHIVQPSVAVFGWKDAQQLIIIRKMVQDLDFPIQIEGVETMRERDGLAMSSRNTYLTKEERRQASWIYKALDAARAKALSGTEFRCSRLTRDVCDAISANMSGARVDYVRVVSLRDLQPLRLVEPGNTMIAAAVYVGKTRLIDNVRF